MSLAYHARNTASAERARRRIQREGYNMKGDKLWTDEERQIILAIGPDFDAIRKKLPHRTRIAIASQCRKMGLKQQQQHIWSAAEISKLRRLYPSASREEICQEFVHSTWVNIMQTARYHGLRRKRRPFKPTGNPSVDEMLVKLFEAKFSLPDLDKECRTKRYFQKGKWRYKRPNYNHLAKALDVLDGEFRVEWREE
ncbi:hypothetical protein G6K88_15735 [Agrobacterium rhizogenes]|uniref:hypothetical protein n=1 Tax=Rhizobium rhizogenes TaxID=359 RepID=UPI001572A130|nr:hypothetical protein [Rhizobium rhizogenes]NTI03474.1 hypothetical protein [Rhizobium rhizogenes]NTI10279.1 hypothetical protein [Rhizobium rhizogenes]